jgi:GTP-binding protein
MPIIAIVGRQNVGKSTLFNKLVKRRTAIVHDLPGVTRDRHEAVCSYRGRSFTLIDTGGFAPDPNEAMDVETQSTKAIDEADHILFLMDAKDGLTPLDETLFDRLRRSQRPIYIVINKTEGGGIRSLNEFYKLGHEPLYPISAEHNQGLSDLLDALYPLLSPQEDILTTAIPKIVVLGRPNVGKSTLINTLLEEERLVTSPIPGTTRDAIDTHVTFLGKPYLFIDTAGIRKRGKVAHGVEQYSVGRAKEALERADIALLLLDGGEGIMEQDTKLAGIILNAHRGLIPLINKSDLLDVEQKEKLQGQLDRRFPFLKGLEIGFISGKMGVGIDTIFKKVEIVYERFSARISTSDLNQFFEQLIERQPPPSVKGKRVRIYYATQAATAPPTFVLFVNTTEILDSYIQYVENRLRVKFGFTGVPVKIQLRLRTREQR